MGTCQGLRSPVSPRMVTSIRSGKPQVAARVSAFTQLPTPLDCMRSAARSPPSHAPAARATPSSSVVSGTAVIPLSAWQSSIRRLWPASGTYDTCRTPCDLSALWIAAGQSMASVADDFDIFLCTIRPDHAADEEPTVHDYSVAGMVEST